MKHKILFCIVLLTFNAFALDQPARSTKDQGRLSIFSDSFRSHPISNFKAYLSYNSMRNDMLNFSSGHSVKLPKGGNTLEVIYENPLSGKFSIKAYLNGKKPRSNLS